MEIVNTNIGMFLTGGVANTDPNLSIGGNVSTTEVIDNSLHNLFRRVTDSEAGSGVTIYRCVAIKNKNATDTMLNCVFYMTIDTLSNDDQALYSNSVAAKNVAETAIGNEFTTPTGTNFIATLNRSGGVNLGDLAPGEYKNVWMRITVNPSAQQFPDNKFKVRVEVNGTGTSDPPDPDPDPDTGITFTMAALGDMSCGSNFSSNWTKIKARNPGFVLFNGDDAYSSGSNCWLTLISSTWLAKSITSFGNHDVDESESQPSTMNNLLNAYPAMAGKTYAKMTFNSVGIIIMESGENQSVSDAVASAQYVFVKAALEEYNANSAIEWIFVMNHYPLYGPSSNHSNNTGGRDRYDPLFDTNGVDVVFSSHNHNIWHSKLIKYNSGSPNSPTESGTDPDYSYNKAASNHGKIYIGSGAGGRSHYSISSSPSYVAFSNDSTYAYLLLEFSASPKKITFKFYSSSDTLLNTFTLTHT